MTPIRIREIEIADNKAIEKVIRDCFPEFGIPLEGTAYADPETKQMFQSYNNPSEVYFVVEKNKKILGGAGIKGLEEPYEDTCELQKMYFSPELRGLGIGKQLFQKCIDTAKEFGYKRVYIETTSQLKAAIALYESFGFKYLDKPLGNTGHFSCGIWMIKTL